MTARLGLIVVAIAFVVAEILRPTVLHPKKFASRALLIAPQNTESPRANTVGPELLADLPRIHPDAPAMLERTAAGNIIGTILDPYTRRAGAAVFPIVDHSPKADFAAEYRDGHFVILPIPSLRPGKHTVAVGLIATDQRGYFQSAQTLQTVTR